MSSRGNADVVLDARSLGQAAARAIDWLDGRVDLDRASRMVLVEDLERLVVETGALARAAEEPPAIGLLSASPTVIDRIVTALAGSRDRLGQFKGSHLRLPVVSGLLASGDRHGAIVRLTGVGRTGEDVVRQIIPGDGRTTDGSVRLGLLSLSDVVTILAAAYLANVRFQAHLAPDVEAIADLKRTVSEDATPAIQTGLAAHHVREIRGALETRFPRHPWLAALAAAGYWDAFASVAGRAGSESRRRFAALLWGGLADFDAYYGDLAAALEALSHAAEVIGPAELVRDAASGPGWGSAHPMSVVSVATLLASEGDGREAVPVRSRFGQPVMVARHVLAALVSEVTLSIEATATSALATSDLIVLPTAAPAPVPRAPRRSDGAMAAPIGSVWLPSAYLQARTLHLAASAAASFALTGLIVHLDREEPLSHTFAPLLAEWVSATQGRTQAQREANETTLFVAVSASQSHGAQDGRATSWHALADFVAGFGAADGWIERWGLDQPFDNVFILGGDRSAGEPVARDAGAKPPALTSHGRGAVTTYDPEPDGALWLRHVRNAAVALDEALNTEDGGARYLAQSVATIGYDRVKRRQITVRLGDLRAAARQALERHVNASNPAADHDWRHRAALAIQARLRQTVQMHRLGGLLRTAGLTEPEAERLFERALAEVGRQADGAQTAHVAGTDRIDEERAGRLSARYAQLVRVHWARTLRRRCGTTAIAAAVGLPTSSLVQLADELIIAALRIGLEERLASDAARMMVKSVGPLDRRTACAATLATEVVNGFLANLGFDSPWSASHPRRRGTLGAPLFERAAVAGADAMASIEAERITLQYGADWYESFPVLVEANLASARGMRFEDGDYRQIGELLTLLGSSHRDATP